MSSQTGLFARFIELVAHAMWRAPDADAQQSAECVLNHFSLAESREQEALLLEAAATSPSEVKQIVDTHLAAHPQPGTAPELQLELLDSMRQAAQSDAKPIDAVARSLNRVLASRRAGEIEEAKLPSDRYAVGKSLVHAALTQKRTSKGPRTLPRNAPLIPGYELLQVVGDGGFSVVYQARHTATGTLRAVKIGPLEDPKLFAREVDLLKKLSGPHIVKYYEHGELDGRFWIAMDYLSEHTLADLIAARPEADRALELAAQVLRGLATLHTAGTVHRDLKPENAMVDGDFNLRLIDFGLSRLVGGTGHTTPMTTGLVGTAQYMSPEQINEKETTRAVDVWAFGCILYELLTGERLFKSTNFMLLGHEILTHPIDLTATAIPEEIRPVLARCLERNAAKRPQDAAAVEAEFRPAREQAQRRLRHERNRPTWEKIRDGGLLERLAEANVELPMSEALTHLARLVRDEGIDPVDEKRLEEILSLVMAKQRVVVAATTALREAKLKLREELMSLTASQIRAQTNPIEKLEQAESARKAEVSAAVREVLKSDTTRYEDRHRSAYLHPIMDRTVEKRVPAEAKTDAQLGQEQFILTRHRGVVTGVAWSLDGMRIVTASEDKRAILWDALTGEDICILRGHAQGVTSVAFSPDGQRIVTGSADKTAKVWDALKCQEILTLRGHTRAVSRVAFSPDGKSILTGSADDTAKVWDAEKGQAMLVLNGHTGFVESVAFSPDGKRILTGSEDDTAKMWDTEKGQELLTFKGHANTVTSVAFSPDGKRILTGSKDSTAKIWDSQKGTEILAFKGHSESVTSVAISPDGRRIVTGSRDKTAKVWDAQSGSELQNLAGHTNSVTSVALSPDGKRFLTASADGTVKMWIVP